MDILIIFIICFILSFVINILSYLLGIKDVNINKVSIYECGFSPINNAGKYFNIKFFVIGIIFLMFDLEIVYLYPFSVLSYFINYYSLLILIFFIIFILLGYYIDWIKGGLEWE
nr:NADH dehydrogenase subunit 3 [Cordagalma sp.]